MLEFRGPKNVLDQFLDYGSGGVSKHLGQIADSMNEWEGSVAEELELSPADIIAIKTAHPSNFKQQVWVVSATWQAMKLYFFMIHPIRRAALEKWKQCNGPSATYRNLIATFEQADRKDAASKVYEIAGR